MFEQVFTSIAMRRTTGVEAMGAPEILFCFKHVFFIGINMFLLFCNVLFIGFNMFLAVFIFCS